MGLLHFLYVTSAFALFKSWVLKYLLLLDLLDYPKVNSCLFEFRREMIPYENSCRSIVLFHKCLAVLNHIFFFLFLFPISSSFYFLIILLFYYIFFLFCTCFIIYLFSSSVSSIRMNRQSDGSSICRLFRQSLYP